MKRRMILGGLGAFLLVIGIEVAAQGTHAGDESPDWWRAQRDVVAILMGQKKEFVELAADVTALKPVSGQEAMFKLNVLMRGGMSQEAKEALGELRELCPGLSNHQIDGIYCSACDEFSSWNLAQALVEMFAGNISQVTLENWLLKHFDRSGWSVEEVDRWLASMPAGRDNFWVKERLRFNVVRGRGDWLVRELSDHVKRNPHDIGAAVALLDALIYARRTGEEEWDLSWMAETTKPARATEAESIASRLKTLKNWSTATTFYRQAIETPLTDKEVQRLGMMCAAFVPDERLRAMFAAHTREGMAECLLKLGQNDEAQEWMVEAADIREKYELRRNALFAGQVQAASGERVIEGRIKEEEQKSETDPDYWRERARYYRGRNEPAQEEEALRTGLALTTPQLEPERPPRGRVDWRSWLLRDYAHFLLRVNRPAEAVALLRKEIEGAPATSPSANTAARVLTFDFAKHVSVEDEALWNWLANRPKWEHGEERLLWRMLENARRDDLEEHFSRAEELVDGKHASRAHTLGWIMNRMRFPERSIPLLEYALEKVPDKDLEKRVVFTLFESYLDMGDWKRAEDIFPSAANRLTPSDVSEWYGRIAARAAKAGARVDALRIWKAVANVNPAETGGLDNLVKAGLRDELLAFYGEMRKKMPSSEIPTRALEALGQK